MATKKEGAFKELAPDCVDSELAARLTLVVSAASADDEAAADVGAMEVVAATTTLEDVGMAEDVVVLLAAVALLTRGLASVGYCQFSSQ